jgi:hypothetical protein
LTQRISYDTMRTVKKMEEVTKRRRRSKAMRDRLLQRFEELTSKPNSMTVRAAAQQISKEFKDKISATLLLYYQRERDKHEQEVSAVEALEIPMLSSRNELALQTPLEGHNGNGNGHNGNGHRKGIIKAVVKTGKNSEMMVEGHIEDMVALIQTLRTNNE